MSDRRRTTRHTSARSKRGLGRTFSWRFQPLKLTVELTVRYCLSKVAFCYTRGVFNQTWSKTRVIEENIKSLWIVKTFGFFSYLYFFEQALDVTSTACNLSISSIYWPITHKIHRLQRLAKEIESKFQNNKFSTLWISSTRHMQQIDVGELTQFVIVTIEL